MKLQYLAGAGVAAGFLAFGMGAFKSSLTPYVSFAEARTAASGVQVAGAAVKSEARYNSATGELTFPMVEKKTNDRLTVVYRGPKPASFDQAEQVVAVGRYQDGHLDATKLLVKCPSKYNQLEKRPGTTADAPGMARSASASSGY